MDGKIVEVIEKYQTEQICDIFIKRNLQIFCRYAIYFSLTASNILQLLTKLVYGMLRIKKNIQNYLDSKSWLLCI